MVASCHITWYLFFCSQYTVHATRLQGDPRTGLPICVKRKDGELLQDVEDLGRPQVKFLFSPGAEQSPAQKSVKLKFNSRYNIWQLML